MTQHPVQPVPPNRRGGLRVLVVDDHAVFREVARAVLAAAGFSVVGEAADGAGALALVDVLDPDVVLLDIGLPDLDGFEVCERLAAQARPPLVVLTSSRDAADYGDRVAAASARGFLPKAQLTGAAILDLVR